MENPCLDKYLKNFSLCRKCWFVGDIFPFIICNVGSFHYVCNTLNIYEAFIYDIRKHKKIENDENELLHEMVYLEEKMNKGIQQEKFKIWDLKWFCFDKKG